MKIICIGTYPPRKCGIATFTKNLVNAIYAAAEKQLTDAQIEVIAMNESGHNYNYPDIVTRTISDNNKSDYITAADYINNSGADICLFQHEYGIYGGNSGLLVLSLLKRIKIPIVSTFHSVLHNPSFHQREVLKKIGAFSAKVIVMNVLAIDFLKRIYDLPSDKILVIEHGIPNFESFDRSIIEKPKSWEGRTILLTFGLLGRSKGIETVIKALPYIIDKHPELLYVVLGKTHPHVVKYSGEEYRDSLEALTNQLELKNNVEFVNRYVTELELVQKLLLADIYVSPYLNKNQITSGTLCYAVGSRSAVVSTPYWHAKTLLANGIGCLYNFGDHIGLAEILVNLLNNPDEIDILKNKSFIYGKTISWTKIGMKYLSTFNLVVTTYNIVEDKIVIPNFTTEHLERLTDCTGLIQHSNGCVPDYNTGYCLDDNARALIVSLIAYKQTGEKKYLSQINTFLSFLMYMQEDDGSFKNYLSYDRKLKGSEKGSDDAFGRAIWALGILIQLSPNESLFHVALDLFNRAIAHFSALKYVRGYANCILGLYHYLKKFPDQKEYIEILTDLADKLVEKYEIQKSNNWDWFETMVTYDNGLIPAALYLASKYSDNKIYFDVADATRKTIEEKCLVKGELTLIGNKEWWIKNHKTYEFAQQPIDAMAMIIMYKCAYRCTSDKKYIENMKICFDWFFGKNDLNLPVYDQITCGCHDGLENLEVNRNQGAESTIAYLLSWLVTKPYFDSTTTE